MNLTLIKGERVFTNRQKLLKGEPRMMTIVQAEDQALAWP
jgi:hypothetical protein